jgi:hypothetical protein
MHLKRKQNGRLIRRGVNRASRRTSSSQTALRAAVLKSAGPARPVKLPVMIDTAHGIVRNMRPELFVHRNCLDEEQLAAYLKNRKPYVSLSDCLAGRGDALTIDDSTVAAANTAQLARKFGHEVTIFINGYNVEKRQPYFFSQLNVALDKTELKNIRYAEVDYPLQTQKEKESFRMCVKKQLSCLGTEEGRQALVAQIGRLLEVDVKEVPDYLCPITQNEVQELLALGVKIENHGWSHVRVGALPASEHEADILQGRNWLRSTFNVNGGFFAVPNGDGLPLWESSPAYDAWFLLYDHGPIGKIKPQLYNRRTLTI